MRYQIYEAKSVKYDAQQRYQNMIDRLSSNIENGIENIQNRLDAMEKRHASG